MLDDRLSKLQRRRKLCPRSHRCKGLLCPGHAGNEIHQNNCYYGLPDATGFMTANVTELVQATLVNRIQACGTYCGNLACLGDISAPEYNWLTHRPPRAAIGFVAKSVTKELSEIVYCNDIKASSYGNDVSICCFSLFGGLA
jgi:hypothetical protein